MFHTWLRWCAISFLLVGCGVDNGGGPQFYYRARDTSQGTDTTKTNGEGASEAVPDQHEPSDYPDLFIESFKVAASSSDNNDDFSTPSPISDITQRRRKNDDLLSSRIDYEVTILNRGGQPSGAFRVDVYLNEPAAPTINTPGFFFDTVSGLASGEKTTLTFTLNGAKSGDYTPWVQVDTEGAEDEANELNNTAATSFSIAADTDWYQFQLQRCAADVRLDQLPGDYDLELYTKRGNPIGTSRNASTINERISTPIPEFSSDFDNRYRVVVLAAGKPVAGNYRLTIEPDLSRCRQPY